MPVHTGPICPIALPEPEVDLARASSATLSPLVSEGSAPLTVRFAHPESGEPVEMILPSAAVRVLLAALTEMAAGHPVTLVPLQAELSTQQAAELLGVSRPYFVKLLEQGALPYRKVGEQRRVRHRDLLQYLNDYQRQATAAVAELTQEAQELGLYE